MGRRVILHIGMHKTGTTSLQQTLGNSRHILEKFNVYYPSIKPFNHSANFPPVVMSNPLKFEIFKQRGIYCEDHAVKESNRLRDLWVEEFKSCKLGNFIISGEELSKMHEEDVRNMDKFLKRYFDDIIVIIYVREPSSFIPSVISEFVKHGGKRIISENYTSHFPFYKVRIQKYINTFGNNKVIVRSFNKNHFKNNDLFDDFFAALNIKCDTNLLRRVTVNQSLSRDAVMFLLEYNNKFPRYKDGEINIERGLPFRLNIFYEIVKKVEGEKFALRINYSDLDAKKINEEIDYVNQLLPEGQQFVRVNSSANYESPLDNQEIPTDYYLSLINEYNKRIDKLLDENEYLKNRIKSKTEKITTLHNIVKNLKLSNVKRDQ